MSYNTFNLAVIYENTTSYGNALGKLVQEKQPALLTDKSGYPIFSGEMLLLILLITLEIVQIFGI
jgi:hypothetical protein